MLGAGPVADGLQVRDDGAPAVCRAGRTFTDTAVTGTAAGTAIAAATTITAAGTGTG